MDDQVFPTTHMTMMHSTASSSQAPATDEAAPLDLQLKKGETTNQLHQQPTRVAAAVTVDVCLAAASLAGAALLTWWALAFHPSYAQLWMVPVGLVLACTPVVVCAALYLSPSAADDARVTPPLSAVVVDDK